MDALEVPLDGEKELKCSRETSSYPACLSPLGTHGALQRSVLKSPSLCTQGNQGSERGSDSPELLELVHDEPDLYLLIWLREVLDVAHGIFSYGRRHLVP